MKFLKWTSIKREFLGFVTKLLFLLLISINAHARFLVEPKALSYSGEFKVGSESGKISGTGYGISLGYFGNHFMAGINIERSEIKTDSGFNTNGYQKFNGGGVGTFIGFYFLDSFKLWTGYLNSVLEPTSNKDYRYFGQHFSIGLGYRFYKGFMINIEGYRNQYTQEENDVTGQTRGLDSNIKTEGSAYSLSYIFAF